MTTLREAAELGLEYAEETLQMHDQNYGRHPARIERRHAIEANILKIRLALAEPPNSTTPVVESTIPEGWQLVPKEPTDEMFNAAWGAKNPYIAYQAMLAAAPEPENKT